MVNSLYRTYRPRTFAEVIGQKHITQTLVNQIKSGRVAHAYLFCGTRGTGKTSVAKIFAAAVCGADAKKNSLDIFELDAASNNSVQDVRDIIEKVKYPPVVGERKVYIIDEVHMFSGAAFNAFLKTLEEPPPHAIFILCTTEPQKLPPTVLSRCLRFDFRPVSSAALEKHLADIVKKEGREVDDGAIRMLAAAGAGSVRDALSFTETALGFVSAGAVRETDVAQVLGVVSGDKLAELLIHIKSGAGAKISASVNSIFDKGINTSLLLRNFLDVIKTQFLLDPKGYGAIFKIFSELEISIKNSTDARTQFENTCLLASV